jgi:hypothetical protein
MTQEEIIVYNSGEKNMILAEKEAREGLVFGWNLRCNVCGSYGATWQDRVLDKPARPKWGALALCPFHKKRLNDTVLEFQAELSQMQVVNFHN